MFVFTFHDIFGIVVLSVVLLLVIIAFIDHRIRRK